MTEAFNEIDLKKQDSDYLEELEKIHTEMEKEEKAIIKLHAKKAKEINVLLKDMERITTTNLRLSDKLMNKLTENPEIEKIKENSEKARSVLRKLEVKINQMNQIFQK